jgi:hypothetical protein
VSLLTAGMRISVSPAQTSAALSWVLSVQLVGREREFVVYYTQYLYAEEEQEAVKQTRVGFEARILLLYRNCYRVTGEPSHRNKRLKDFYDISYWYNLKVAHWQENILQGGQHFCHTAPSSFCRACAIGSSAHFPDK